MELRKLVILVHMLLSVLFAEITSAEPSLLSEDSANLQDRKDAVSRAPAADSSLELEIQRLKSKIDSLETAIEEKTGELNGKNENIMQLEKVIEEKSNVLFLLKRAARSVQEKASSNGNGRQGEVVNLKKEIEAQNKKKVELEVRANVAEKKIEGMNLKLENLRRINEQQKLKIRNIRRSLQVAEEEMLKSKLEASSLTKKLEEVHQVWLPSWISTHLVHFQSFVTTHWNEWGRPALDLTIDKVLEKKAEFEKWMQPHLETFKTKGIPTIKKCCETIVDDFHLLLQLLSTQAIDFYHVSHSTIAPHVVKIIEIVDPYFQEAKLFTKPFIDQVSKSAKPQLDKALLVLKPYSKKVFHYHKYITKKVRTQHFLVQATLHETLKSYELTKFLATEGLVWFMASVLLALPVVVFSRLLLQFALCKEPKMRHQHSHHTNHRRRRAKRMRPEK